MGEEDVKQLQETLDTIRVNQEQHNDKVEMAFEEMIQLLKKIEANTNAQLGR